MLNDRLAAAQDVAARLFALEQAIDDALAKAAELTISLPAARSRAKLSAVVAQDATSEVAATLQVLAQARHHAVQAHHHLADTQVSIGLKTYGMGGLTKLLPHNEEKAPLKVVA
ncbi:MAG TPA: hypothetical protein PKA59_07480 [Chakrabartia sp.]|jgi:hypothetical protein|nr:hypothetical protein [Chakrabartia sp.]